jgi:multiple sugar transport system permease protein
MFNETFGIVNKITSIFGIESINWLNDPTFAMPAVAFATIWWTLGFNIILYLSAIQQIPDSYYEAATLDGANSWQRLIHITVPLIKSTHILVIILQIIYSLQIFGQVYIMTGGGPGGTTRTLVQYIYENGFKYFKMGYAQANAAIFFLIMLGVAIAQVRLMSKRGEGY